MSWPIRLGARRGGRHQEGLEWLERQAEAMRANRKIAIVSLGTATGTISVSSDFEECGCGSIIWATEKNGDRTITRVERIHCQDHEEKR